ncbi:MAG: sigma factor-like helix-turn-helix DNA-binding protein [Elusimicrobiota bacterium]|jgi:hypothetical protein
MPRTAKTTQVYWYPPRRGLGSATLAAAARRWARILPQTVLADTLPLFQALRVSAWHARRGQPGWAAIWTAIRERLAELHGGLVGSMCYAARRPHDDEALSAAGMAYLRAIDRFDPWRGFQFSTYACNAIARQISRLAGQERLRPHQSIDDCDVRDTATETPEPGSELLAALWLVRGRMGSILTAQELLVVRGRWLTDKPAVTFRELGEGMGLSKERARQIESAAFAKLRVAIEAHVPKE